MSSSTSAIQSSLERHNDTFESLLKLIPAKYYLAKDPADDQVCIAECLHKFSRLTNA